MKQPSWREMLVMLANEWEIYADRERTQRGRRAYRDCASALRQALWKIRRGRSTSS